MTDYSIKAEPGVVGSSLEGNPDEAPKWQIPRDLVITLKPTCALCSVHFGGCAIMGEGTLIKSLAGVSGSVTCNPEEEEDG